MNGAQPVEADLSPRRILVIGGGWFGCHIALEIKRTVPSTQVTIFERSTQILDGVSGKFGIRLHAGPHYPRSATTRKFCHDGFIEFLAQYPELVNDHSYSHYGLGFVDANGEPSKIGKDAFVKVCREFGFLEEVNMESKGYKSLEFVANVQEPSAVVGDALRSFFVAYLKKLDVQVYCNYEVTSIARDKTIGLSTVKINNNRVNFQFHHVINATSFQSLLPQKSTAPSSINFPLNLPVVYQARTALIYKCILDPLPKKPFSFIVMDGCFPGIQPSDDQGNIEAVDTYLLCHHKWTTLGTFETKEEAEKVLLRLSDAVVETTISKNCESEMAKFWPGFSKTFKYAGWKGTVLAKVNVDSDFSSAAAFRSKIDDVIYVFPGKINNVFQMAREVMTLVGLRPGKIGHDENFEYTENGILAILSCELKTKLNGYH